MGFYDRDYYREQRSGFSFRGPQTVVGTIIAVNVAVWLIDGLLMPPTLAGGRWLSDHMAVHVDTLGRPWLWWQYVTYAFAHSPRTLEHILFNMLGLFFLGRDVEAAYGRREFLRLYLVMAAFAAVTWNVVNLLYEGLPGVMAYGASGAIAGVVILFALNFPHRTILLFFVIPMPAWLLGVFVVGLDVYGAMARPETSNVAYTMHLAGAAFAAVYCYRQWNLTRLTDALTARLRSWNRPKLRVVRPDDEPGELNAEVDRILEKIYREGEANLTAKERRTLETASREYQRKGHTRDHRPNP